MLLLGALKVTLILKEFHDRFHPCSDEWTSAAPVPEEGGAARGRMDGRGKRSPPGIGEGPCRLERP
jgi:hypothetical protein